MNYTNLLDQEDILHAQIFFKRADVIKAQKILNSANINISFQKGSLERYFVISGLIKDGNNSEARVSFKKNDDHPDGTVTTSCNCLDWTKEGHCYHSAALFLKFHQAQKAKETLEENNHKSLQANVFISGSAVHVSDYGRIITNANKLLGANANSTYSSLQYLLTNKKIINFPIAKDLVGKIKVNFVKANTLDEFQHLAQNDHLFFPIFSFINEDKTYDKISLFEYLYLFNWETGTSHHIPSEIKEFIKKILLNGSLQDINTFYKWVSSLEDNDQVEFYIEDKSFKDIQYTAMNFRYSISQSSRKSYLNLDIEIYDDQERLISAPSFF